MSCQPFTHNVSFMNASCADLILFRAEQGQYGAHENTPEHPADPFDILLATDGNWSCNMTTWMPCEDKNGSLDHPILCFCQIYTASHRDRNRNGIARALSNREITLLSVDDVIKANA